MASSVKSREQDCQGPVLAPWPRYPARLHLICGTRLVLCLHCLLCYSPIWLHCCCCFCYSICLQLPTFTSWCPRMYSDCTLYVAVVCLKWPDACVGRDLTSIYAVCFPTEASARMCFNFAWLLLVVMFSMWCKLLILIMFNCLCLHVPGDVMLLII